MAVTLHIPDSIMNELRLPESEIEQRLRLELSLALYSRCMLSFGKACEWAEVSRTQLAELLTERDTPRHYGAEEWAEDLAYARGSNVELAYVEQ